MEYRSSTKHALNTLHPLTVVAAALVAAPACGARLIDYFPDSEFAAPAGEIVAEMSGKLARKVYQSGDWYFRRRAYDSAIIYFQDVADRYPKGSPSWGPGGRSDATCCSPPRPRMTSPPWRWTGPGSTWATPMPSTPPSTASPSTCR